MSVLVKLIVKKVTCRKLTAGGVAVDTLPVQNPSSALAGPPTGKLFLACVI